MEAVVVDICVPVYTVILKMSCPLTYVGVIVVSVRPCLGLGPALDTMQFINLSHTCHHSSVVERTKEQIFIDPCGNYPRTEWTTG